VKRASLEALLAARDERATCIRLVWLADGRERLVTSAEALAGTGAATDSDPRLVAAVEEAIVSGRGQLVELDGEAIFVHPFAPRPRLVIVGAVHIAQHLAVLARDLGYGVTVVDPRQGFLTKARFSGTHLDHAWPEEALARHGLDARCAVVTLSHDPKIDEPALVSALRAPCFYIGALGSRRTQAKRRGRLAEAGLDEAALARIHGPVGLDIGARSPAEIAVSIAAEMTACLRGRAPARG